MPFGDQSFEPQNLGYMTSEQALADYADLILYLKVCSKLAVHTSF